MSTIEAVEDTIGTESDRIVVTTWETMTTNGDVGEAVRHLAARDRCVQFTGTWGSGGTAVLQGSNDNTTWFTLKDPQGNSISKTADGISQVQEIPLYVRPKLTAGTGSIDIDVKLVERRGLR